MLLSGYLMLHYFPLNTVLAHTSRACGLFNGHKAALPMYKPSANLRTLLLVIRQAAAGPTQNTFLILELVGITLGWRLKQGPLAPSNLIFVGYYRVITVPQCP